MPDLTDQILKRIRQIAEKRGTSMRAISLESGNGPDLIRQWGGKKAALPRLDSLQAVANALGVSPGWLAYGNGEPEQNITMVPLLSFVSAGQLAEPNGNTSYDECEHIPAQGLQGGDWIALRVEGDSMDDYSPPGSIIFVNRSDKNIIDGGFYVVCTEDGEATYKRYRKDPDRLEPQSSNKSHEIIFPRGPLNVIGRVKRTVFDFPA
ncbi:phage repressor protein [Martelella lutilitoris]|uniref:Phage repressor protein n=1 Tax=Martelella lutilitoris TaxID=2583532 RepID=A0A5C4JNB9_9HYPH|nr:S24 family peptidase [Martelella lutilitoris]TNB46828.1 phage repressor protein [Martelella lutilitoris]